MISNTFIWNMCISFPFISYPQSCNFLQNLISGSWFFLLVLFCVVSFVLAGENWCLPVRRLVHVYKYCLSGSGSRDVEFESSLVHFFPFLITVKCNNLCFKIILSTFSMCMFMLVLLTFKHSYLINLIILV